MPVLDTAPLKRSGRLLVIAALLTLLGFASAVPSAMGQAYSDLYNFGAASGDPEFPAGFLAQGTDGNLYGTANSGAANDDGGVFRITPGGSLTLLSSFTPTMGLGTGLTASSDGNFYGTTVGAGLSCSPGVSCGTLFSVTPSGVFTDIHDFMGGADGEGPQVPPLEGLDHRLYGTTDLGGRFGSGTGYIATPAGEVSILGSKGDAAKKILVFNPAQNVFYGVSANTVFKATPFGKLTVLYNFGNGNGPWSLVQGSDDSLYGTTFSGGDRNCNGGNGCGMIYRITRTGRFQVVHNFEPGQGRAPTTLLQASDGSLYGTTLTDLTNNAGTIFKVAPDGTFSVLYNFTSATGQNPQSLFQHTNGLFYGLTEDGGTRNRGVFFSFDLGLPAFVRLQSSWGSSGETIGILGQGFLTATAVSFNGVPATFNVVSDTNLTAEVPDGASTGSVTVTTSTGTLTSNTRFYVVQ